MKDENVISLKAARINADLSQKEVAKLLDVTVRTVQSWETEKTCPNIIQARKLATILNWPLDQIFFGKAIH